MGETYPKVSRHDSLSGVKEEEAVVIIFHVSLIAATGGFFGASG